MEIFAPYLSKALLHRIDLAKACSDDLERQKPELHRTSAYDIFSGEGADPRAFRIERTRPEKDGSEHVYVSLTFEKPTFRPWTRRVAAVVLSENGHNVIDDVIYINDNVYDNLEMKPADILLSEYLSAGCDGARWGGYSLPDQPEALVRSLYKQVVARRPVGIPSGADWKTFAPYLGRTLLHRIDLALACGEDWYRQNPDPNLKPEFGWLELGLFSNGDDEDELRDFQIERTESKKDGSSQVYVRLTWGWPPDKPWITRVAAVVLPEDGRLVVDDVVYLKDDKEKRSVDGRLSKSLSYGCEGPRWVGFGHEREGQKKQK
ncbi:MAG: hypothetical protein WCE75_00515 [Terracidiphilus sp.]